MKPDTVPAWVLARSMVVAQYAATLKNNAPSPRDRHRIARYGSVTVAPAKINPAAHSGPPNPIPHRPIRFPNRRLKWSDSQPPIGAATALARNGAVLYTPPLRTEKPRTLTR